MIFNSKYNDINTIFGELGWVIGCLGDSSSYNVAFLDIADRVAILNEGGKVNRKPLLTDIDSLFVRLEKEGYSRESTKEIVIQSKQASILSAPFRLLKIFWNLPEDGKASIVYSSFFLVGCCSVILSFIFCESWAEPEPSWIVLTLVLGGLSVVIFGIILGITIYDCFYFHSDRIKRQYKESK